MRAVVVANGEVDGSDAAYARSADLIIAADGGSTHLAHWGIAPHLVMGDLDSAEAADMRANSARVEQWPREKDKSDTELAVGRAIAFGADEVVVLGALGGPRVDHEIANVLLLALDGGSHGRVRLVRGDRAVRLASSGDTLRLSGAVGDLVTLLAVGGDAEGVRTDGLRYPLRDEALKLGSSRGISNEIVSAGAKVSVRSGSLLVIDGGALAGWSDPQAQA